VNFAVFGTAFEIYINVGRH